MWGKVLQATKLLSQWHWDCRKKWDDVLKKIVGTLTESEGKCPFATPSRFLWHTNQNAALLCEFAYLGVHTHPRQIRRAIGRTVDTVFQKEAWGSSDWQSQDTPLSDSWLRHQRWAWTPILQGAAIPSWSVRTPSRTKTAT